MKKLVTILFNNEFLKAVDKRVGAGNYSSRTEYIHDLIRQDLEGRNLQTKILAQLKRMEKVIK